MNEVVRVSDGSRFAVVGAGDVLVIDVNGQDVDSLTAETARSPLAGRVVLVCGDWSVRPAEPSVAAPAELLPWEAFAPALRDELKDLAARYGAVNVHHAAVRLGELMAEHGAGAAAVRRAVAGRSSGGRR